MKVKTGMPRGTWKRRDPHPTIKGRFFAGYGTDTGTGVCAESWLTADKFGKERRKGRKPSTPKHRSEWKVRTDSVQTGSDVGHFKRGDMHPAKDRVFNQYLSNGIEFWLKPEAFERQKEASRISARNRPRASKAMPTHTKAHRQSVRDELRIMASNEKEYLRQWGIYGNRIARKYDQQKDLPRRKAALKARRAENRKNNPAQKAAHRLARRLRRDQIRKEFNALPDEDKKRANAIYKWRDLLNKAHGRTMFVVDHVKPAAKGGRHCPDNLQVTTYPYNEWKSDRLDAHPPLFNPVEYDSYIPA